MNNYQIVIHFFLLKNLVISKKILKIKYPLEILSTVQRLMGDEDVTRKSGIYEYILYNNERALNIRTFDDRTKHEIYEVQGHKCAICGEEFEYNEMHGDHIIPWSNGGHTVKENCQLLCRDCNLKKSNK